jgi:osmoprotectant transport system permease protein
MRPSFWEQLGDYLGDPASWALSAADAIPQRAFEHLLYSLVAVLIAAVLTIPIGCLIGHTGRGSFWAINAGNVGRALPTLGVLTLAVLALGTGIVPVLVALVLLAVPSLLNNTYAGIRAVERSVIDAARGTGMRERQILTQVELPNALPIMLSGLRNATLQVIATATVAAYVGNYGLGEILFDGLAVRDYGRMAAAALLVALLAVVVDGILAGVERLVVSPGVSGRTSARGSLLRVPSNDITSTDER